MLKVTFTREPCMQVSIDQGIATLPNGQTVNLLEIQSLLNWAFQETGDHDFAKACEALATMTRYFQGASGEFLPGAYSAGPGDAESSAQEHLNEAIS